MRHLFTAARATGVAREALCYVVAQVDTGGRAGGYFGLFPMGRSRRVLAHVVFQSIGTVRDEKRSQYRKLAQEKPRRLSQHLAHVSSWQSRDPDHDRWGGAIVAGNYYLSFSGLPELCDEALVLITARTLGLLTDVEARRIAGISQNGLFVSWADTHRV